MARTRDLTLVSTSPCFAGADGYDCIAAAANGPFIGMAGVSLAYESMLNSGSAHESNDAETSTPGFARHPTRSHQGARPVLLDVHEQ